MATNEKAPPNQRYKLFADELRLPDFCDGSNPKPFQSYFRSLFLDAVNHFEPTVLESLRDEVWGLAPGRDQRAEREPLFQTWCIKTLSARFHLTDSWIVDRARMVMDLCSADPAWQQGIAGWPAYMARGWSFCQFYGDEEITWHWEDQFSPLKWEFLREPWSRFESELLKRIRAWLYDYRSHVERVALSHSYRKSPKKRSRDTRHPLVAFEWLALYQVCGKSADAIAIRYDPQKTKFTGLRRNAVMDQIHWARQAIDLTLRGPGKPGRPRKN